jgi:glycosyltransferase involved in cell wall biosynthesis
MTSQTDAPLVSVIMIFLNGEQFIAEAIESALTQTYDRWELLLVDDGSADGSSAIARGYTERFSSKIRYLEHGKHESRGMSASRNLGISYARGTYIAFLDADDVWLPSKLERQVDILTRHPEAALVCGRTEWWYSWTGKPEDRQRDFLQKFSVPPDSVVQPPAVLNMFLQDEWASLCDIMVRRSAIDRVGSYEEIFRGMYEDQAFHAKLCFAFPVFVSGECWYRYRQHEKACTTQSHQSGLTTGARYKFLVWLEDYLDEHGGKNTSIWRVVRKQLFPYRHPLLMRVSGRAWGLVQRVQRKVFRPKLMG